MGDRTEGERLEHESRSLIRLECSAGGSSIVGGWKGRREKRRFGFVAREKGWVPMATRVARCLGATSSRR